MNETCPQEKLKPLLAVIAILICGTIALAFYYAEDIREARINRRRMALGTQQSARPGQGTQGRAGIAAAQPAAFAPPWHGQQNPNAVTGATPKRVSVNRAIGVVSPAVVGINTSGGQQQGGSGIIVHPRGYILTSNHVVAGARNIVVTLVFDQLIKSYAAEPVASEPGLDLAIIRVISNGKEVFPPAPLGNSDGVFIGQDVVAIGNPFGLAQSASAGIISNTRRTLTGGNKVFADLIQTDAAINPGSSGGALANTNGEVIGVNAAIYSPFQAFTGIGFAVPINKAKKAFGSFIQAAPSPLSGQNALAAPPPSRASLQTVAAQGLPARCWLGIDVHPTGAIVARELNVPIRHGVLVNRVFTDSPAGKAGLTRGDVIYRIDNRRVKDQKMLWSFLADRKAGDDVSLAVFRNGRKETIVAQLVPEPPNIRTLLSKAPLGPAAGAVGVQGIEEISWLGIDIQPLTDPEALQEFGIPPTEKGVLVGEVEGIAAIDAGLAPGDLIKKINNHEILDIQSFKEVVKRIDPSKGAVLDIVRQKRPFYVTIQPAGWDRGAWQ